MKKNSTLNILEIVDDDGKRLKIYNNNNCKWYRTLI